MKRIKEMYDLAKAIMTAGLIEEANHMLEIDDLDGLEGTAARMITLNSVYGVIYDPLDRYGRGSLKVTYGPGEKETVYNVGVGYDGYLIVSCGCGLIPVQTLLRDDAFAVMYSVINHYEDRVTRADAAEKALEAAGLLDGPF